MSEPNLDRVRVSVLDRFDRAERNFRFAFGGAVALEAAFLLGFLLLADLSNRLHVLLLMSGVGVYGILCLGLVALGAHVSRCTERVLRAIESSARQGNDGIVPSLGP